MAPDSSEESFWTWLQATCQPPSHLLEPPAVAAELAPHLSAQELAAICCEHTRDPVPAAVLAEASHWVWHAVAAYGKHALLELSPHPWLARLRLLKDVFPRGRAASQALPNVQEKVKESREYAAHYASGKLLVGYQDADIIHLSFADSFLGAVPYAVVLDRQRRTVVLTIRGTASMAGLLSDLSQRPEDMADWLPHSLRQAHRDLHSVQGHTGILSAAKAVLADLNSHQIIHILLTGQCRPEGASAQQAEAEQGGLEGQQEEAQHTPREYRAMLQRRGLDCRGWRLVLTGHSLGAGIAALLAPHFAAWWPEVHAWAYCPPGGMVTPNLAAALQAERLVTCVVVGKDSVSRTSTVNFERLQDQVVVALARCRVSKLRVLLRGRTHVFKRLPASTLFHPPESIPEEALGYARSYFRAKQRYKHELVGMEPPGRCFMLRRLKGGEQAVSDDGGGTRAQQRRFDTVWVERSQLMEAGIQLSRRQVKDHYTARLTAGLAAVLHAAEQQPNGQE